MTQLKINNFVDYSKNRSDIGAPFSSKSVVIGKTATLRCVLNYHNINCDIMEQEQLHVSMRFHW